MEINNIIYEIIDDNNFVFVLNEDNTYDVSLYKAKKEHIIFSEKFNNINVTSINSLVEPIFYNRVKQITIPKSIKVLNAYCFKDYMYLEKINFTNGLEIINEGAFNSCYALEEIIFPDSVKIMGLGLFEECRSLKKVVLSKNLEYVSPSLFSGCFSILEISIDNNNMFKTIDGNLYSKDGKILLAYARGKNNLIFKIPYGVEKINKVFFRIKLDKLIIPKSLKVIEKYTFENLMVNEIVLEEGIKIIEDYAFDYSTVKYINIPKSVNSLSKKAFHGCENLNK